MDKSLVIFDLDGTLMDTSEGIIFCYNKTARRLGYPERERDAFRGIIGGPVLNGFRKLYGMDEETAEASVLTYREYYRENGINMAQVYEGIPDVLRAIKNSGAKTAVATLKYHLFAEKMLEEAGLKVYFDTITGYDGKHSHSKAELLKQALASSKTDAAEAILIGDSAYDAIGAEQAGVDFIGVTYGWGFDCGDDISEYSYAGIADKVDELPALLARFNCCTLSKKLQ